MGEKTPQDYTNSITLKGNATHVSITMELPDGLSEDGVFNIKRALSKALTTAHDGGLTVDTGRATVENGVLRMNAIPSVDSDLYEALNTAYEAKMEAMRVTADIRHAPANDTGEHCVAHQGPIRGIGAYDAQALQEMLSPILTNIQNDDALKYAIATQITPSHQSSLPAPSETSFQISMAPAETRWGKEKAPTCAIVDQAGIVLSNACKMETIHEEHNTPHRPSETPPTEYAGRASIGGPQ